MTQDAPDQQALDQPAAERPVPGQPAPGQPAPEQPWQRLDRRMLLVHPVREVIRFLPLLVIALLAGFGRGGAPWELLGVAVPVAIGLARYLSTRFRIADERVELRTGLVVRHARSAALDRVRTVDLDASLVHRTLGLSTVRVGTGTADDDQQLELDGLRTGDARALRDELLRVAGDRPGEVERAAGEAEDVAGAAVPSGPLRSPEPASPVLVLDPRWARYAPLTSTGVVVLAAVLGFGGQLLDQVGALLSFGPDGLSTEPTSMGGVVVLVAAILAGALLMMALLAVAGYLATYWGFTLRLGAEAWQLRRGLLTTRETSIDVDRLAGVRLHEPLSLRVVGAARLSAIVTGLRASQSASSLLVPPAPRAESERVAGVVLDSPTAMADALESHGAAAVRRRWTRALIPGLLVLAATVLAVVLAPLPAWSLVVPVVLIAAGAALAADRARSLGHAHHDAHVVSRSGSLLRRREALADDHVIGWNLRASWWQRRVGLTTLAATTAGGPQSVQVLDVPEDRAVALASTVLPHVVDQFLARTPGPPDAGDAPAR